MRTALVSTVVALTVAAPAPGWAAARGQASAAATVQWQAQGHAEDETEAEAQTEAVSLGAPGLLAAPDPREAQLQALYLEAQQRVDAYNSTRDLAQLSAARTQLAQWLVEHTQLYGEGDQAAAVRAPVQQQLGLIDQELARAAADAQPTTTLQPLPVQPVAPVDPRRTAAEKQAKRFIGPGATFIALGGATLLGATLPLVMLRARALERANSERFYVDELRFLGRARRREAGAIVTGVAGGTMLGVGVLLLTVGLVKRSRARREFSLVPSLSPRMAGVTARLRF